MVNALRRVTEGAGEGRFWFAGWFCLWLLGQLGGGKSEPSHQQAAPGSGLSESGRWTAQSRLPQPARLRADLRGTVDSGPQRPSSHRPSAQHARSRAAPRSELTPQGSLQARGAAQSQQEPDKG